MTTPKKRECVRCHIYRTQRADGVCKVCLETPWRLDQVDELRDALAWAVKKFGIRKLEDGHGYGVVGAAKVRACVRRLEAATKGQPLPVSAFVRDVGGGGVAGVRALPDDGRQEVGTGHPGVHADAGPAGDAWGGGVQGLGDEEEDGVGEGGDAAREGCIAFAPCRPVAVGTVAGVRRGDGAAGQTAGVAGDEGRAAGRGRVDLFGDPDWPYGTLFFRDDRVIVTVDLNADETDDVLGVVLSAWEVDDRMIRYAVQTDAGVVKADEDDIDLDPTPDQKAKRVRRVKATKPATMYHSDLFAAVT